MLIMKNKLCEIDFNNPALAKVSPECNELLRLMLKKNPYDRISAAEISSHPFIKQPSNPDYQRALSRRLGSLSFDHPFDAMNFSLFESLLSSSKRMHIIQEEVLHMSDFEEILEKSEMFKEKQLPEEFKLSHQIQISNAFFSNARSSSKKSFK